MATAIQKALNSKAGQAAIRGKSAAAARRAGEKVKAEMMRKLRAAKSRAKPAAKDLMSIAINPVATGAVGALGLDMAARFSPVPLQGARGDVGKAVIAIAAGYFGKPYIKSEYFQSACLGAAIVNAHRFATRVVMRAQNGTLPGIFAVANDADLAGLDAMVEAVRPVAITFESGHVEAGFIDSAGNLFDSQRRPIPVAQSPALEGIDTEHEAFSQVDDDDASGAVEEEDFMDVGEGY